MIKSMQGMSTLLINSVINFNSVWALFINWARLKKCMVDFCHISPNRIILKNFKVGNTAHITISDDNSCLIHAPHCFTSYFQLSYPRECKSKKIYITLMKSACSPGNPQGEKVTRKISLTINWWVIIIKSNLLFWNTQKNSWL